MSIIIPVYNAEKYIHECLQSCINQDIDYSDYEIICINDGSTDTSLNILQSYAEKYENIIVINKKNSGVSATRNIGLSVAKGDYIWFVDSDDFIETNCLRKLQEIANDKYDVICFVAYLFGEVFSAKEYSAMQFDINNDKIFYHGANFSSLYRLETIKNNNINFKSEIAYGEDTLFLHEVHTLAKTKKSINDIFYFYRKNPESAMNSLQYVERKIKYIDSTIKTIEFLKNGLESGRFTGKSSGKFLISKYKLCLMMLVRLDIKNAVAYYKIMVRKGFFDKKFNSEYKLPSKGDFFTTYIIKHSKIWIRGLLRRILPPRNRQINKRQINFTAVYCVPKSRRNYGKEKSVVCLQ